jgi:hypothetical protein
VPTRKSFTEKFKEGLTLTPEGEAAGEIVSKEKDKPAAQNGETTTAPSDTSRTKQPFVTESKAAPDDTPPEVKSDEGKKSWKTWKEEHHKVVKERDNLRAKSTDLETQVAKLKTAAVDAARLSALQQENEDLNTLLRRVKLQEHPEFKARFEKPLEVAIARAKQVVPAEKSEVIEILLRQPWSTARASALDEIMGDLSPSRANALGKAAEDALATIQGRSDAMKDEADFAARIAAHDQQQAEAQQAAAQRYGEQVYRSTLARVLESDGGLPLFQAREGDNDHNQQAQEAIDEARQILLGDNKPETLAEAAFWAAYGRRVHPLLRRAESEIAKLQKQVDSLTAAKPKTGTPGSDGAPPKPRGFVEAIREAMRAEH